MINGPKRRQIRGSFGNSLTSRPVGVDDPQFLLRQSLLILRLGLKDGAEGQLHAIGAPGGADDGRIAADGHFGIPPRLAIDQIDGPDAEPSPAALPSPLESDAIDIAPRAPARKQPESEGSFLARRPIQQPNLPFAAVSE